MDGAASTKIASHLLSETANGNSAEALIVLSEQADLRGAARFITKEAKGAYVFQTLHAVADRTQAPLRRLFEQRGLHYQSFFVVNMIKVTANRELIEELAQRYDVATLQANPRLRNTLPPPTGFDPGLQTPGIEWNVNAVNAPGAWALGYNGTGRVVGSADTGVKWDHPALKSHYRGWNGHAANHAYNWHDATSDRLTVPTDPNGHGTFTTSEMVGDDGMGNQVGVAPGAKWIACRNMDRNGDGNPAQYIECFQFFIAPYPMGHPELGNPSLAPDVINNSWACPPSEGCSVTTLLSAVNAVRAAGIFPVMAAGNSGPNCSTVSQAPAIYDSAFSVGATDSYTNSITMYSSRGPVTSDGSGRLKPDLAAPGDNIRGAVPYNNGYQGYWSGTSMAAPEVSGGVAIMWQAKPSLKGNVTLTETLLEHNATPTRSTQNCGGSGQNVPNNAYGYGFLNILKAVQASLGLH